MSARYTFEKDDFEFSAGLILTRNGESFNERDLILDYIELPIRMGAKLQLNENWSYYFDLELP